MLFIIYNQQLPFWLFQYAETKQIMKRFKLKGAFGINKSDIIIISPICLIKRCSFGYIVVRSLPYSQIWKK